MKNLKALKDELINYGRLCASKGYSPGISGNISTRSKENIIITSSGSSNAFLEDKDFSIINYNGECIGGNKKPSSEKWLHLEFYKIRDDINCIFHVHSPYLTAFATAQIPLEDGISPEIIYCFGKIPLAGYSLPGSNDLVKNTSKYFNNYDVILMANHGVIVGGKTIKDTFLKLDLAENYAKTLICAKILGGAKIIDEMEIKKIYSLKE